jgi:UTP--glucose-1-phosphate uridylyltransferase
VHVRQSFQRRAWAPGSSRPPRRFPRSCCPIIDTPALQLIIDEAVGAGIEHVVVVTSHAKPAIEAYFADAPEVVAKLRSTGRHEVADHLERIGRDVR